MEGNCSIHLSHLNVMCRARPTVCGASCSIRAGKDVGYDPPHRPCTAAVLLACIRSLYQIYCNCKLQERQETLCMLCILVEVISRTFGNFFFFFLQRHKLWQFVTQMAAICANLQIDSEARKCEEHVRYSEVFQAVVTNCRRGRCISFRNFPQAGDEAPSI